MRRCASLIAVRETLGHAKAAGGGRAGNGRPAEKAVDAEKHFSTY